MSWRSAEASVLLLIQSQGLTTFWCSIVPESVLLYLLACRACRGQQIAWFVLASHNLSKAAWGSLQKQVSFQVDHSMGCLSNAMLFDVMNPCAGECGI